VKDGIFFGEKGNANFAAAEANWSAARKTIEITKGVRVANKDIDLAAQKGTFNQKTGQFIVPKAITGKAFGGQVGAGSLRMTPAKGTFALGAGRWQGVPPVNAAQEAGAQAGDSKWEVDWGGIERQDEKFVHFVDVTASDGDIIVKGQRAELERKTDILTVTGKVEYYSAKANFVCAKAVIYRKEKRAVLTQDVNMYFKPKDEQEKPMVMEIAPFQPMVPDEIKRNRPTAQKSEPEKQLDEQGRSADSIRKYPVSVKCDKVEYWYAKGGRRAIITGTPEARQILPGDRWRHIWTHHALYNGETERLSLLSSDGKFETRARNWYGDDVMAKSVEISTKDGDDYFQAKQGKGRVYSDPDEIPKDDKKPEEKKAPPPATTTGGGTTTGGTTGGTTAGTIGG
jgi:hypothetical protein